MAKFFKTLFKFVFYILIILVIVVSIYIGNYAIKGYNAYKIALTQKSISELSAEIKNKENFVSINEIPQIYKDAVIAVEDHRFYEHHGVDYAALFRAVVKNIVKQDAVEGGSTITQQLCKNEYFTQERTLTRKFAEMFMAREMENTLSKDEILELYINTCFYGYNCYTLKEASNLYFDVDPSELTDYEAIMISGIPNAPSLYNPIYSLKLCKERMNQVLCAMVKYGYITEEESEQILENAPDLSKYEK